MIDSVVLMSEFIQHLSKLYMFRTSSVHHQERFVQAVCADLVCGNTCRVVRVLPHNKSANTACKITPDDVPVRSETCRANIRDE